MYKPVTTEEARILFDAGVQLGFVQYGSSEMLPVKPASRNAARVALQYRVAGHWFAQVECDEQEV